MPSPPVILITGASRGLGAAIAAHLLAHTPAHLFLVSRTTTALETLHTQYPTRITYLSLDLSTPGASTQAISSALAAHGRLDALILNHGTLAPVARLEHAHLPSWRASFDTNYFSYVEAVAAAIPALRDTAGRVVFVSSGAAGKPYEAWGAYGGAKAAVNQLCVTLAGEEAGIVAVSVRPGVMDTEMQREIREVHLEAMGAGGGRFVELEREGRLLRVCCCSFRWVGWADWGQPEQPGSVIARLAIGAGKELSGRYLRCVSRFYGREAANQWTQLGLGGAFGVSRLSMGLDRERHIDGIRVISGRQGVMLAGGISAADAAAAQPAGPHGSCSVLVGQGGWPIGGACAGGWPIAGACGGSWPSAGACGVTFCPACTQENTPRYRVCMRT